MADTVIPSTEEIFQRLTLIKNESSRNGLRNYWNGTSTKAMNGKAETKKEPFSGRFGKITSEQNGVSAKRTKLPESQPLHPPLTNLALIPNEIAWPLTKKAREDVIADVLRGKTSTIVVDAGTTKVQARLYGGYHPDWVTGGMWANSSAFISCINKFCKDKKFNFIVTFDSSIDVHNLDAWLARMEWEYESVKMLFHGTLETSPRSLTHPPGAFTKTPGNMWFPPTALQTSLRLICLSMGIKLECTLFEHEPEIIAVRDLKDPASKSIMDEAGAFFTNSLEYMCYSDVTQILYWGETLKLNMRGDRMTGKTIDANEVSKSLGVIRDSLDAGLLYYGTRYFKDESSNLEQIPGEDLFDPTEDLHHEILAALTANDQKPAARLHTAVEIMQQVHKEGVNNKETMKIGESLLPSMEHLKRCLKERTSLPPHFQHLTSSDIYDSDKVEDELQKLRKKASNLFFDIGKRLLEGRTWPTRKPYYERQSPDHPWERIIFPHQKRFTDQFRDHLEKFHRSGNIHEWIGHLVFSEIPTIKINYTLADRGFRVCGWKEEPKSFFRDIRRRAYGLLFGTQQPDYTADANDMNSMPQIQEIFYSGMDVVQPISISREVANVTRSSEEMWGKRDRQGPGLHVLLHIVMGASCPNNWHEIFMDVPEYAWVPVIAIRYMLDRFAPMFREGYLDSIIATVASVVTTRVSNPKREKLEQYDTSQSDYDLLIDASSITFASFFMSAVEHVIFANDVCCTVITSPNHTNPAMFFDGNVFHTTLDRLTAAAQAQMQFETFLGSRNQQKQANFLKIRNCVLYQYQDQSVMQGLMQPMEDTVDQLMRRNLISASHKPRQIARQKRLHDYEPEVIEVPQENGQDNGFAMVQTGSSGFRFQAAPVYAPQGGPPGFVPAFGGRYQEQVSHNGGRQYY